MSVWLAVLSMDQPKVRVKVGLAVLLMVRSAIP